ncbi:hypothetical protein CTAYLR_001471 [Chrysophaeum taylorii]|uniref:RING-CH-type domain-containing protein n=1 Tax=Chrysophaeum taylorii TaxID=2483200 RepID=A0AAD7XJA2_9STRA|nr:hypothetical protein CTAYLR_001471 [Chrysophaeum taylorii]
MAIERVLARLDQNVPSDATCFICLEGGRLLRGCACRGTAGCVHVDCLAELAQRDKDAAAPSRWTHCITCRQGYTGALQLEMARRLWRRNRSESDKWVGRFDLMNQLRSYGETEAVGRLDEGRSVDLGEALMTDAFGKIQRCNILVGEGRGLEALDLLMPLWAQGVREEPMMRLVLASCIAAAHHSLGHDDDSLPFVREEMAISQRLFGPEDTGTFKAMTNYAKACARTGRLEESQSIFADVLRLQTRVLGEDHAATRETRANMNIYTHLAEAPA